MRIVNIHQLRSGEVIFPPLLLIRRFKPTAWIVFMDQLTKVKLLQFLKSKIFLTSKKLSIRLSLKEFEHFKTLGGYKHLASNLFAKFSNIKNQLKSLRISEIIRMMTQCSKLSIRQRYINFLLLFNQCKAEPFMILHHCYNVSFSSG